MKKFWTFIGNGRHDIGLTGQAVHVYAKDGTELAVFKDLKYAYSAVISPRGDILAVKSTEGTMAIYSLDEMRLIRKFRFSKISCGQDENMVFSPAGDYLYSIENHTGTAVNVLTKYRVEDFLRVKRLFEDRADTYLSSIEYDAETDSYYVMGIIFGEAEKDSRHFVARLVEDAVADMRLITQADFDFYRAVISVKDCGCTEKSFEWSEFKYKREHDRYNLTLDQIKALDSSLAGLYASIEK